MLLIIVRKLKQYLLDLNIDIPNFFFEIIVDYLVHTNHVNPLSPNTDQHQISPCNVNAYSTPEVMRIKDMITQMQGEFLGIFITSPQYFYKKSMGTR